MCTFLKFAVPLQVDLELGRGGSRESIAHDVDPSAEIRNDVIVCPVNMPRLERFQDRLARVVLRQHVAVAHVRGDMVRTGFETQLVAFLERQADPAFRSKAADRIPGRIGPRRVRHLVILTVALIDLDHGFRHRIVVASVRAHGTGAADVRRYDAIVLFQVAIKHQRIGRLAFRVIGRWSRAVLRPSSAIRHWTASASVRTCIQASTRDDRDPFNPHR